MGLLMMIIFKFGWAKAVPVNMYNFKNPKGGMALTAFAGPLSNIILAAFFMALYGFMYRPLMHTGEVGSVVLQTVLTTAYLSCAIAVFNLIPIPPLDGSKVLFSLLPQNAYNVLMRYERFGMFVLLALIYFNILTPLITTATSWIFNLLYNIAQWCFALVA